MTNPTLLILAAGAGSRYGGMKSIEPVGPDGESIVEYSIYDAHRAGFGRIVFVIRGDMERPFKEMVNARFGKRFAVECVYQDVAKLPPGFQAPAGRAKPWGTTHAILMAEKAIREPFAVINVHDFYGPQSYRAMANHLQSGGGDCAMAGFVLRNTMPELGSVARGVCEIGSDGYLQKIVEYRDVERVGGHARNIDAAGQETALTGDEVVSMNMWGFMPGVFGPLRQQFQRFLRENDGDLQAECFIPNTVNELLKSGHARVKVLRCAEAWFGVTYREDHTRAAASIRRLIEAGNYPKRLW